MAALCHLFQDPDSGEEWLKGWAGRLGLPELDSISLRSSLHVIAEPLHEHRFAYLWDILFARHPKGEFARGLWQGAGTEVPGKDILLEMFKAQPTALLLDEFQTWFDGLSDTGGLPRQVWAFNFVQLLSEIAETNPELLTLVVSVREGSSNAAQQLIPGQSRACRLQGRAGAGRPPTPSSLSHLRQPHQYPGGPDRLIGRYAFLRVYEALREAGL
jgi:hypothetical protein